MKQDIQTESFVVVDDVPIPVTSLSDKKREVFSRWLRKTYIQELFRGRALLTWEEARSDTDTDKYLTPELFP